MTFMPANNDSVIDTSWDRNQRILTWLTRMAEPGLSFENLDQPRDIEQKTSVEQQGSSLADDWQMITSLCGYTAQDFNSAGSPLPITVAEVDYFRRNHRSMDNHVSRDFLMAKVDLPSPLSELYGLYLYRARFDAESTLFVAQSTGSTRVARIMADLLSIGSFGNGLEFISYLGLTYSVPAAFDTSAIIDRANFEASRRLALNAEHPSHLLKLTPDEIGVLAANIADQNIMNPTEFLDKANLLAEARQDVTRLPTSQHFATALMERDLPIQNEWVERTCAAFARVLESWVTNLTEAKSAVH
jgi:hypothetical protein